MGASNALSALALYASKVPPTSLVVLAYMALVSVDKDTEPWWSQGHAMLAVQCLGRPEPKPTGDGKADQKATEAMRRAVERAITPLLDAGAITVDRHSSGRPGNPQHVRYRLWLQYPAPDEIRRVDNRSAPDGKRRARNGSTRRKVSEHPTESVRAPDEKRRTKEYEEYEEREKDQEYPIPSSDSVPVRAREAADANFGNRPARENQGDREALPPPPVDFIRCEYEHCPVPHKQVPADSRHHHGCGLAMRRAAQATGPMTALDRGS